MMVTVIASSADMLSGRVWGTGGWVEPKAREALDWLTLVRFLGWDVRIAAASDPPRAWMAPGARAIIIAADPDTLSDTTVQAIACCLENEPVLVIGRAPRAGSTLAKLAGVSSNGAAIAGRSIDWAGPGDRKAWRSTNEFTARQLVAGPDAAPWALLEGAPIACARPYGRGIVAVLGLHPSEARDVDPAGTALMKALLTWGVPGPTAWLDFERTMVLRMDDPGGAQNVYSRTWCYPKLTTDAWAAVGRDLEARQARISLAYISGWVDDGDESRGRLTLEGRNVDRIPGAIHPSPLVRYTDTAGHAPGTESDYVAEFQGIQALRRAGLADVELHGFTHMHPDREAWLQAADRFECWPATSWFREFGRAAVPALERLPAAEQPLVRALALFREYFSTTPTTLICPGDHWTDSTIELALDLGLQLVGSYYLAIRHQDNFCWTQHVCAPYLNKPAESWFESGLPVVGYFHDYEPALEGVQWMTQWLDRWSDAGARRFIDFRELASAVGSTLTLSPAAGGLTLTIARQAGAPAAVRPIPVRARLDGRAPGAINVVTSGGTYDVPLTPQVDGTGLLLLPIEAVAM